MFLSMFAGLAQSRLCSCKVLTIKHLGLLPSNSLTTKQLADQPVGP